MDALVIFFMLYITYVHGSTPPHPTHTLPKNDALNFLRRRQPNSAGRDVKTECCNEDGCNMEEVQENKQLYGSLRVEEYICQLVVDQNKLCRCNQLNQGAGQACSTDHCTVDGGWTVWSPWSSCTRSCNTGSRRRSRSCTNPPVKRGGADCSGVAMATELCNTDPCPVHGNWSPWNRQSCSKTCGAGTRMQTRSCTNPAPAHNGRDCSGSVSQTVYCKERNCPINGGWTQWTSWSECSQTCAGGRKSRQRSCSNPYPQYGGTNCYGGSVEFQSCNSGTICPVHGNWSPWNRESCSKTCGDGTRRQTRTCTNPAPAHNGRPCSGDNSMVVACTEGDCPCAALYQDQMCPPNNHDAACLFKRTETTITRVSRVEETEVFAMAGIEVGLLTLASAGTRYIFRDAIHKEITVRNEEYILLKSGSVVCRFQEVRNNACYPPTYNYVEMRGWTTKCSRLPVCSSYLQQRCIVRSDDDDEWSDDTGQSTTTKAASGIGSAIGFFILCFIICKCCHK